MLTDERLKQLDGLASESHVPKYALRNAINEVVHAYRALQQQNKQLIEALEKIATMPIALKVDVLQEIARQTLGKG